LFGSYKRGFLSGGFNAGSGDQRGDRSFNQQTIKGIEGGLKVQLLDRALSVALTGYSYTLDGLQVLTQVGLTQFIQNAGKARVSGADLTANYRTPLDGLSLQSAFGYNRARYKEFITNCYAGQTIALGCNLLPNAMGAFTAQDLAGTPLLRAPKYNFSGGATFEQPLSADVSLTLNSNATYSSSYFADPTNAPRSQQDSYWLFDAGISITHQPSRLKLALLGRNLGNQRYFARTRDSVLTGGRTGTAGGRLADIAAIESRGREIWVRLSYGM